VNAVAAIDSSQIGIVAMMGSSQAGTSSNPGSDATSFLNLFNFLMPASGDDAAGPAPAAIASPGQVAGALIRSMLGMKQEDRSQKTEAGMPADNQPGSCANSAGVSDPSVGMPAPAAVPSLPVPQAGDALTNVSSRAAVPAELTATALLTLDQTALQCPLAFGARLVKTGGDQNANPEPASPPIAVPAPGDSSQPVLPIAKYEPSKRDPQGVPAPATAAAGSSASQAIPAAMLATVSEHAAPSSPRVADAAPQPLGEALRTSEPAQPAAAPNAAPAQEIVLRVARAESSAVDVQVTQRAGEVYVAVRTADQALQTSLRQDLPSLVNSLERAGYHAETFTPQEMTAPAAAASSGRSFNGRQQDAQPDTSDRNWPDPSGGRHQEQRQRDRQHQNWLDEMEK
jgi:hypothetical protein